MKQNILHCNFCGSSNNKIKYSEIPNLVACSDCGLVYTTNQMTPEVMKQFYSEGYFISDNVFKKGYDDYFNAKKNIIVTFNKRMNLIERYHKERGKVLDVGCAAGFFLHVAKLRGWDICGVDISELCTNYARTNLGIEVNNDLLININFKEESFDLITMWDYLEHSITPREDIIKSRALLRKGGLLVIATPDISSIPSRLFKSNWIGIKLEEHFYYFSKNLLSNFLRKNGFMILKTAYIGKYVSSTMFLDRLQYYNKHLYNSLKIAIKNARFSFYCNPMDIMLIICKKV